MPNIRTYPSLLQAQQAADFLRANGIIATVLGGTDAFAAIGLTSLGGRFIVSIAAALERDRARGLLDEFDAGSSEQDLETEAVPDLSLLDPRTPAPCPSCSVQLPLDASVSLCPACKAAVNVVEVLLKRYGPELLSDCYPQGGQDFPDDVIDAALLACGGCEYPLQGLPAIGACPECGREYSKRDMLASTPVLSDDALAKSPLRCAKCRYSLKWLPPIGVCPECGEPYSKRRMLGQ